MSLNNIIVLIGFVFITACGNMGDDLNPSAQDNRPMVVLNSIGTQPGQMVAPFTVTDSNGNAFSLTDHLAGGTTPADAVVIYFTMWCPVCMGHSDHILFSVLPQFSHRGDTVYIIVDYVSGSVSATKASAMANGYHGSPFIILADGNQSIFNALNASMGSVIVIDNAGIIQISEDYKTGHKLRTTLNSILP